MTGMSSTPKALATVPSLSVNKSNGKWYLALKAWWPSADAYQRFIDVQAKISQRDTLKVLKEIKEPEIRTVETIMYARALAGIPMKRSTVVERRKSGMNRSMTTSTD